MNGPVKFRKSEVAELLGEEVENEDKEIVYGVHHPKFNIDNDSLEIGMQMMSLAVFS